jgi:hypothetical protein
MGHCPDADIGRVVEYNDPPVITEVSKWIKFFSDCAIGVSSLCILFLISQTIKHPKCTSLELVLIAIASAFLFQPKNDLYCQIQLPVILIPIH